MLAPRRLLLAMAPMVAMAASAAAQPADAAETTDLALSCDLAAAPAVEKAGQAFRQRTGVRVRIFPTAPGLIVPQLEREIQNDIVVTQPVLLDQAERAGVIQPGGRTTAWRNRLVIAEAGQPGGPENSFAVPDPTPVSEFDGEDILRRMGLKAALVMGVINTETVSWLLRNGEVRQGLLHQTEVTGDRRLRVVAPVPDNVWPPILYAATLTRLARRPDPGAFVQFLASGDGQTILRNAGLEAAA